MIPKHHRSILLCILVYKETVIYELKEKWSHFMSIFKERLRYCRARSGKTQEEVAKETSIAYSTYRRYERGGTQPGSLTFSACHWTIWRAEATNREAQKVTYTYNAHRQKHVISMTDITI